MDLDVDNGCRKLFFSVNGKLWRLSFQFHAYRDYNDIIKHPKKPQIFILCTTQLSHYLTMYLVIEMYYTMIYTIFMLTFPFIGFQWYCWDISIQHSGYIICFWKLMTYCRYNLLLAYWISRVLGLWFRPLGIGIYQIIIYLPK